MHYGKPFDYGWSSVAPAREYACRKAMRLRVRNNPKSARMNDKHHLPKRAVRKLTNKLHAIMKNTTLSPSPQLNDVIIGNVTQRAGDRRYGQTVGGRYLYTAMDFVTNSRCKSTAPVTDKVHSAANSWTCHDNSNNSTRGSHIDITTNAQPEQMTQLEHFVERRQENKTCLVQDTPELLDELLRGDAHLRELRRKAQQRYRKKLDRHAVTLEHEVLRLREQVRMYMLKYQRIPPRTPTSETPWIIVSEYYRLFRNGCKVSQPIQLASTSKDTIHDNCHVQMDFLHKVMAPDVRINSGFGVDAIVQEWLAVPEANRNITVRLLQLEYDERSAMMATIQSCIIITEHMLRCEFPYFGDNQGSQVPPLGKKLLGQSLVISTTVRFEWDSSTGRVLSMHYESDLVTPFLKLLGNLQDTAQVLDKSLLSIATCS